MSLAEQTWFPTSVQVTVHQARNLRVKGKSGTNDAYAIIQVAKDKFSTSVAEKSVAPVWKEEASFDLPLFHPGNAERCTLYIIVMHRAQVGLDKFLGQAVINLLDLHDNKSRKKTDWFKLVDKTGKEDKVRGEVLLDVQFMRNNMSASMFDLSMQDKPRSRISKLKDKVRGKKKDGFSDSASAIVPSVSQVLTDSEGEADAQSLSQFPVKKKSKLKTLFAPKSNLQRNISQSMSTLGTLPEKNSSLSGSRSSGLNVESPEVKKKFKFLGHKRTGSSDSKVSQGPFSLLGRSKQSNSDLNSLCINGSHVYTEEESKSGSTLSLNSSGQGSVEDVHKHTSDFSADSSRSAPVPTHRRESTDRAILEQQRHQEEEERRQAAEAKRLEEEERSRAEAKRLEEEEQRRHQEEQERRRRFLEDEARRKKQKEEEERERRRQEEERRALEAAEDQRLEEERRRADEQRRQEEASMSDRLSSLFGMIRKKEEKKEEAPGSDSGALERPVSQRSTNPFEDVPLGGGPAGGGSDSPADQQRPSHNPQTPSATVFLNRTAKVSAVKPRLAQSLESEPTDCQTPSQLCPSPATSESTLSSVPSQSPDHFSSLHSSLAPPNISSPWGSTDNLSAVASVGSSHTMADKKRRAPPPPTYPVHGTQSGGNPFENTEEDGSQQGKRMSLPLPDYETLFPQKRHGVQGHTRWDHIIAEVNQKHRDAPELLGPEMSVDGPEEQRPSPRSSITLESPAMRHYQTQPQETKPASSKRAAAPAPPKAVTAPPPHSAADSDQGQRQSVAHQSAVKPSPHAAPGPGNSDFSSRDSLSGASRDGARKALLPPSAAAPAPRPESQMDTSQPEEQRKARVSVNKEAPTAKPRQRALREEPVVTPDKNLNSHIQTEFDPFPSSELLPKDPWAQLKQNQDVDNLFATNAPKQQKPENLGMTADDLDVIFSQDKPANPFAGFDGYDSDKHSEFTEKDDDSKQASPVFQRRNSQRQKQANQSKAHSNNKVSKSWQEPAYEEATTVMAVKQGLPARDVMNESVTPQPQADVKVASNIYGGLDPFRAGAVTGPSPVASSEPLQVVMEEPEGGVSGGKTLLRAWVSPSEVQPVSAQSSNGGGLAFTPRRPHPVKPLTSVENQHATSTHVVKEIKVRDSTPGKTKVADSGESGPYTQLTQEELITLVVKQQTDLSKKDAKIIELEEYIDNLVLRVIEEKPSILQALKPV